MAVDADNQLIGGTYCKAEVSPGLLQGEGQQLTQHEMDVLWRLFVEIGRCWENALSDSANMKSSWLEFIRVKTTTSPSYSAEYSNAVSVVDEVTAIYGEEKAFALLFLQNGIPLGPPITKIAHAKRYVIDEFIRVQLVAGGFKAFGGRNYNGYLGGSRYNIRPRVRAYLPQDGET